MVCSHRIRNYLWRFDISTSHELWILMNWALAEWGNVNSNWHCICSVISLGRLPGGEFWSILQFVRAVIKLGNVSDFFKRVRNISLTRFVGNLAGIILFRFQLKSHKNLPKNSFQWSTKKIQIKNSLQILFTFRGW